MIRLVIPILILLLLLFGGAWLVIPYFQQQPAGGPPTGSKPSISQNQTSPPSSEASHAEATSDQQASFDVARIDPKGTSVFAGRAEPGSTVTIMGDGKAIGTAEADANGEWTFTTEQPFASADPKLALSVKSAAETKAEKAKKAELAEKSAKEAAKAQVAGSLETREAAKEQPKPKTRTQTASSVTSNRLKEFEGIVAAARTEAQKQKEQQEKVEEPAQVNAQAKATEKEAPLPEPSTSVTVSKAEQIHPEPTRIAAAKPEVPEARKSIPVPVTFIFDEATFTDNGRKAAALLLEYLQLKHFPTVTLTGHADERGTDELNMELSKERLDTVAHFLREGGYTGKLDLIPKGESEPYTGVDRSKYSQEELYQFDRRVELIITP